MTERIGPVPGMPAPQPVVSVSQPFSSQAGVQSFRRGVPLSGAPSPERIAIEPVQGTRRRASAGWPGLTGSDGLPLHA